MRLLLATLLALVGSPTTHGFPSRLGGHRRSPQEVATSIKNSNVAFTRGGGSVVGSTSASGTGAMQLGIIVPGVRRTGTITSGVSAADNFASSGNGQVVTARQLDSVARIGSGGAQTATRQQLEALSAGRAVTTGVGTGAASSGMQQAARGLVVGPNGVAGAAGDNVATTSNSRVTAQNSNQGDSLTRFKQLAEQKSVFTGSLAGAGGVVPAVGGGLVTLPGVGGAAVPLIGGGSGFVGVPITLGHRLALAGNPNAALPGATTTTTTTTTRRPRRRRRMMRSMRGRRD